MYIKIEDQDIYYQKLGKGKDLIMLHGWGQDVSSFWGVVDKLKDDFTVWLIDLPGFGRSKNPVMAFSVSDYSEVVRNFILEHKIHKPILLGHSLGGRISIKLSSKYPDLISKLILEDSAGIRPKQDIIKFVIYPLAKMFKYILPDLFNIKKSIRERFYRSLESDYLNAGELKETLTKILKEDLTPDLPKIKNETLLIWGEKDFLPETTKENGKKMYRLIINSKIEVLDNVGHFPHLENPHMFLYFLKDFAL